MTVESLTVVNNLLNALNINYEYGEWTKELVYPYFVGEYSETPSTTEDGLQESTFTLNGWSRGKWLELETAKEIIKNEFKDGKSTITDSSSAVVVIYSNCLIIPQDDAELKRIQINLNIKEWMVN